ncbi:hypothetical protein HZS_6608, partial [Henneguya salminicola]
SDANGYKKILEFMTLRHTKKVNVFHKRFEFGNRARNENEKITEFALALRDLALECNFGNSKDERIRDQFVLKLNDMYIQQEIMRHFKSNDVSVESVIEEALVISSSRNSATIFQKSDYSRPQDQSENIYKISEEGKKKWGKKDEQKTLDPRYQCIRCGKDKHKRQTSCPALEVECTLCKIRGHFARCCIKSGKIVVKGKQRINLVDTINESFSEYFVFSFDAENKRMQKIDRDYKINLFINGQLIKMLLDTGATVSCVDEQMWVKLGKPKLSDAPRITNYPNNDIKTLGMCKTTLRTPAMAMFGRNLRCKIENLKPSMESNIVKATLKQKKFHDRNLSTREFKAGDP